MSLIAYSMEPLTEAQFVLHEVREVAVPEYAQSEPHERSDGDLDPDDFQFFEITFTVIPSVWREKNTWKHHCWSPIGMRLKYDETVDHCASEPWRTKVYEPENCPPEIAPIEIDDEGFAVSGYADQIVEDDGLLRKAQFTGPRTLRIEIFVPKLATELQVVYGDREVGSLDLAGPTTPEIQLANDQRSGVDNPFVSSSQTLHRKTDSANPFAAGQLRKTETVPSDFHRIDTTNFSLSFHRENLGWSKCLSVLIDRLFRVKRLGPIAYRLADQIVPFSIDEIPPYALRRMKPLIDEATVCGAVPMFAYSLDALGGAEIFSWSGVLESQTSCSVMYVRWTSLYEQTETVSCGLTSQATDGMNFATGNGDRPVAKIKDWTGQWCDSGLPLKELFNRHRDLIGEKELVDLRNQSDLVARISDLEKQVWNAQSKRKIMVPLNPQEQALLNFDQAWMQAQPTPHEVAAVRAKV